MQEERYVTDELVTEVVGHLLLRNFVGGGHGAGANAAAGRVGATAAGTPAPTRGRCAAAHAARSRVGASRHVPRALDAAARIATSRAERRAAPASRFGARVPAGAPAVPAAAVPEPVRLRASAAAAPCSSPP